MTTPQIKCIRSPFNTDMEVGKIYNYVMHENVVEYSEAFCWAEKKYLPIYAFANAMQVGDVVNVRDLPQTEEN